MTNNHDMTVSLIIHEGKVRAPHGAMALMERAK